MPDTPSNYCDKDHAGEVPLASLNAIPKSQRLTGGWRHKCAACAYLRGYADAVKTEERLRARIRDLEAKLEAALRTT